MPFFDHEKLDVYRLSIEFAGFAAQLVKGLRGGERHIRDQLLRCSQSIPLNIAEGNGKRPGADRRRFLEIARGSALESAAALDVLIAAHLRSAEQVEPGKRMLQRIVNMLTALAPPRPALDEKQQQTPTPTPTRTRYPARRPASDAPPHGNEYECEYE